MITLWTRHNHCSWIPRMVYGEAIHTESDIYRAFLGYHYARVSAGLAYVNGETFPAIGKLEIALVVGMKAPNEIQPLVVKVL